MYMSPFQRPEGEIVATCKQNLIPMERHTQLRRIYLFVFSNFAVTRSEVAENFSISKDSALTALKRLEERGLVCRMGLNDIGGGMVVDSIGQPRGKGGYIELVWQAIESLDDYTEAEADRHFLDAFPLSETR